MVTKPPNTFASINHPPASGLYYLSELVEEHTVFAKKILSRLIYGIIAIQILLAIVDRFPALLSLLSIGSHAVYAGNLRRFPIVKLTDPVFISSCGRGHHFSKPTYYEFANVCNTVLVLVNHFLWFRHFSTPPTPTMHRSPNRYEYIDAPSFTEVASYFGICVWLVPFALFVSLSAGENILPSMGSEYATGDFGRTYDEARNLDGRQERRAKRGAKGLVKAAIDRVIQWTSETGEAAGLWRADRRRF